MLKAGYRQYAIAIMESIDICPSDRKMLVPGEKAFGSWQPWELSSVTGRVERHDFEEEEKMRVRGSRYHGATGFWFQDLEKDKEVSRKLPAQQTGLPVESWTLPLYCGFGMIRLIRAATVANETKMFTTPAFQMAVEFLWSSFGKRHFQLKFATFSAYVGLWIVFTILQAQQTDADFLALPQMTQLMVCGLAVLHLVVQRGLQKAAARVRTGHPVFPCKSCGSLCYKGRSSDGDEVSYEMIERSKERRQWMLELLAILVFPLPIVLTGVLIFHNMHHPDVLVACVAAPLCALTLGRTWDEIQQISAEVDFAKISLVKTGSSITPTRVLIHDHYKSKNPKMLKLVEHMVNKYGEDRYWKMIQDSSMKIASVAKGRQAAEKEGLKTAAHSRLSRCKAYFCCGAAASDDQGPEEDGTAMISRDSMVSSNGPSDRLGFAGAVDRIVTTQQAGHAFQRSADRTHDIEQMNEYARGMVLDETGVGWEDAVAILVEFEQKNVIAEVLATSAQAAMPRPSPMAVTEIERLVEKDLPGFRKVWNAASKVALIKQLKPKLEPLLEQRNLEQQALHRLHTTDGTAFVNDTWDDLEPVVKRIATLERLQKALTDEPEAFMDEVVGARQEVAQTIQRFWTANALRRRDSVKQDWSETWMLFKEAMGDYASVWNFLDVSSLGMLWTLMCVSFNDAIQVDLITLDAIASIATMFLVIRTYEYLAGFEQFAHLIRTILQVRFLLCSASIQDCALKFILAAWRLTDSDLARHSSVHGRTHYDARRLRDCVVRHHSFISLPHLA